MNTGDDATRLAAEARARVLIDRQLTDAGPRRVVGDPQSVSSNAVDRREPGSES